MALHRRWPYTGTPLLPLQIILRLDVHQIRGEVERTKRILVGIRNKLRLECEAVIIDKDNHLTPMGRAVARTYWQF